MILTSAYRRTGAGREGSELMAGGPDAKALARAAYDGPRVTAQRLIIARAADDRVNRVFSIDELACDVRAGDPGIGLATVYRAVAAMEATGFVERLGTRDGAALYARCTHAGHHHHLVCTSCGAVTDVECTVDTSSASGQGDFEVTDHRLVLYGVCGSCRSAAPRAGTLAG
jgi:Fur family ferric uptake transcriptional regulator